MKKLFLISFAILVMVGMTGMVGAAPFEVITNGGFETGNFAGWTVQNSGSGNWTINNGTFNPPGPGGALAPISGNFDAVSFQSGPGLHILSEVFAVPLGGVISANLSWSDRIRNYGGQFSDPNQEWRVHIQTAGGAFISEVYSTNPGDPLIQIGPNNRSFDMTSLFNTLAGQSLRVSFQQQDNLGFFNATLDNVSLMLDPVPEPATMVLLGSGLIGLAGARRRMKK